MIIESPIEGMMSLDVRGRMGFTAGVGMARCGFSRCGASKLFGGIYQKKKTLLGKKISRMRYYRPSNPQTTTQQNWRAVFTAGWSEYNSLTSDEKMALSKEARSYRMSGANLFMSRWLQQNRA